MTMQVIFEWLDTAPWYHYPLLFAVPVMIMSVIGALSAVRLSSQISREEEQHLDEQWLRGEITDADYKARRYPPQQDKQKGA